MLSKKNWIAVLAAALILMIAGAMTAYAQEEASDADTQSQETVEVSPTILVGASKQNQEAAEDTSQEAEDSEAAAEDPAAESDMVSLGVFKTTGYCPCYQCSEGWGRRTSTGAIAHSSHTIAVDPRVIPYGSRVMINGVVYTAEDRGGAVRGKHIDIFFDTHAQTRQHGCRQAEVFLIG